LLIKARKLKPDNILTFGNFNPVVNPSLHIGFVKWGVMDSWKEGVGVGVGATDLDASLGSVGIHFYIRGICKRDKNKAVLEGSEVGFRFMDSFDFEGRQPLVAFAKAGAKELGSLLGGDTSVLNFIKNLFKQDAIVIFNGDFREFER
jgi:hypothetical protein